MKCPECGSEMQYDDYPEKYERVWVCLNPDCSIRTIAQWNPNSGAGADCRVCAHLDSCDLAPARISILSIGGKWGTCTGYEKAGP
jgi:hypothetical protein